MKIGLLTFHNAINYGAALQTFATQKYLIDQGYECVIIDYENSHRKNAYNMKYHILSNLKKGNIVQATKYFLGSPFMYVRKKNFTRFFDEQMKLTKSKYVNSDEAKELNEAFDKFIVGSDQVWNYNNNGHDMAYFLDFVSDGRKRISYSSSFGLATIPEELRTKYASELAKFSNLSTRESIGVKIIRDLTDRKATLVLDPVFLLSKEYWTTLVDKRPKDKEKFIFTYTNRPRQLYDFMRITKFPSENYVIKKLTQHISMRDFINKKTKVTYSTSPEGFLSNIYNAEYIISASFHCISMAIIFEKPFVAILTGNKGKDERITSLLDILGLSNRILTDGMQLSTVLAPINYEDVKKKLELYKQKSTEFIFESIHGK